MHAPCLAGAAVPEGGAVFHGAAGGGQAFPHAGDAPAAGGARSRPLCQSAARTSSAAARCSCCLLRRCPLTSGRSATARKPAELAWPCCHLAIHSQATTRLDERAGTRMSSRQRWRPTPCRCACSWASRCRSASTGPAPQTCASTTWRTAPTAARPPRSWATTRVTSPPTSVRTPSLGHSAGGLQEACRAGQFPAPAVEFV